MNNAQGVNSNSFGNAISKPKPLKQKGFTLIELSIVLVIIGLIVGGVLVGQDLIKAAGIRATVQQIEKYNGAVNTFNGKYNGLPGDINQTQVTAFGLYSMAGTVGRGDNNGLIDGSLTGVSGQYAWTQEGCAFWVDLTDANLLDGSFNQICDAATPAALTSTSSPTAFWPVARIQKGNLINVGSAGGLNYFHIGGWSQTTAGGVIYGSGNLSPIEAYSMDAKMDDGAPLTGLVQAHGLSVGGGTSSTATMFTDAPSASTTAGSGYCVTGDMVGTALTDTYNRSLTLGGASNACMVRFRFN